MDPTDLPSLLASPEDETLDFKATSYNLSDSRDKLKLVKALASLANTPRGTDSHLILGVEKLPDGTPQLHGIDGGIDDADLQSIADSFLEPCPRFDYRTLQYNGVLLGVITVSVDQMSPVMPKKSRGDGFAKGCMYFRRGSQNAIASSRDQERIWGWFLSHKQPVVSQGLPNEATDGDFAYSGEDHPDDFPSASAPLSDHLHSAPLLLGPIQALELGPRIEQAEELMVTSPKEAAQVYGEVAANLNKRFPVHAERFEQLHAEALEKAGDVESSYEALLKLAIRDVFERAEPHPSSGVVSRLEDLHDKVDQDQRARGAGLVLGGRCMENAAELERLAESFDGLKVDDPYQPFIATLLVETALLDGNPQIVTERASSLQGVVVTSEPSIELRLRAALADAEGEQAWRGLIDDALTLRFFPDQGTYVCLRGARWCAWNGELDKAEQLYRLGVSLGVGEHLDLDVENALWSLSALHGFRESYDEMVDTNRLALSSKGSRSYVTLNSKTQLRSYQYLANGQLPSAHLWARYRLMESIRSGCLVDELDSHSILARIYDQSGELQDALKHAILAGNLQLVRTLVPRLKEWPAFLEGTVRSRAPWVCQASLLALQHIGDLAPPDIACGLVSELLEQLQGGLVNWRTTPAVLEALGALILEAPEEDILRLLPILEESARRERDTYYMTDPGMMTIASRLYRCCPSLRPRAAAILAEMAVGSHTSDWSRALVDCGEDTGELIEALVRVAERENIDLADSLSELKHLTAETRGLWSQRLQFVAEHPLGKRSEHSIGPRYDVPSGFLGEQDTTVAGSYVKKLATLGRDYDEMCINRAAALAAVGNVMDVLGDDIRQQLFQSIRPLVEEPIQISRMDQRDSDSQHPLSRFKIGFGSARDVLTAAGWVLGRSATSAEERAVVADISVDWLRSGDTVLQEQGAKLLSLPNLSPDTVQAEELAKHTNPAVRRRSLWMHDLQGAPQAAILDRLASDPDRNVRLGVVYAVRRARAMDPDLYECLRGRLNADRSSIVRAVAKDILGPTYGYPDT